MGLNYTNFPLSPTEANQEVIKQAIQAIENLPQPILVHYAAGSQASAMPAASEAITLIATATNQGWNEQQIKQKAQELNITAVFIYLDHALISVFLSSFAPLRLCVRYKDVVHLAENRCKLEQPHLQQVLQNKQIAAS